MYKKRWRATEKNVPAIYTKKKERKKHTTRNVKHRNIKQRYYTKEYMTICRLHNSHQSKPSMSLGERQLCISRITACSVLGTYDWAILG